METLTAHKLETDARILRFALDAPHPAVEGFLKGNSQLQLMRCFNFEVLKDTNPDYLHSLKTGYKLAGSLDLTPLHLFRAGRMLADEITGTPRQCPTRSSLNILTPLAADDDFFIGEIEQSYADMPAGLHAAMMFSSPTVSLARRLTDFSPEIAAVEPKGYEGRTFAYAPAYYNPVDNGITLLQQHRSRPLGERYIRSTMPRFYKLHEDGHALDSAFGSFELSGMPSFRNAYRADLDLIADLRPGPEPKSERPITAIDAETGETLSGFEECGDPSTANGLRKNLCYFIGQLDGGSQPDARFGRRETFAELFAVAATGVERPKSFGIRSAFRSCAALMAPIIASIDVEMRRTPDIEALFSGDVRERLRLEP